MQAADSSAYFFANFEPSSSWRPGPLEQRKSNFVTLRGGGAQIARASAEGGLALELTPSNPFAAIMLDATPLAKQPVVYAETFARPAALGELTTAEFLDFGGAVLGFFREGKEGEICALAGKTESESVWISSGMRFSLAEDGTANQWMRITIRLNRKVGRWDLILNGTRVLAGLRTVSRPRELRLWLYGDESRPVPFDDVLVANRPPEEIEKEFLREQAGGLPKKTPTAPTVGRQSVTARQGSESLRESAEPFRTVRGEVQLKDWHISLTSGDHVYEDPPKRTDLNLIAYAPAYDDAGNLLPVTVTITADAALEPGADLADLRWAVFELLGLDANNQPQNRSYHHGGKFPQRPRADGDNPGKMGPQSLLRVGLESTLDASRRSRLIGPAAKMAP